MTRRTSNFILCSNPRSGTTLLCTLLEQTGAAGRPNSFLREPSLQEWSEHWGIDCRVDVTDAAFNKRYLDALRQEGFGGTSVFGMRLMGQDLGFAMSWLDRCYPDLPDDLARLEAAFGPLRFIHLSRQDKLAEAVSLLRAEQTGLWHQNSDGSDMERLRPSSEEGFDPDAITERMTELRNLDRHWRVWFDLQGITPLHLTYEALAEDPIGVLAQVLTHIGCEGRLAQGTNPTLRKLADQTNADWIAQYRALHPLA
ncbi:Stf0 family sulfotransferase [Sulfitobacter sp. F26204]|uniref:Stf0 family sulfotransferase n=1 Tax=Sulfitobacter sp. F26204 TaxID=2996014 RepID=UPI00225E3D1B|nr:Stf0 family sulfotransferase [Sulfitobacter sp. F26204]MCX7559764.1 Stf0 family sulfotransferase [Sulfitobacter sp. F26204]